MSTTTGHIPYGTSLDQFNYIQVVDSLFTRAWQNLDHGMVQAKGAERHESHMLWKHATTGFRPQLSRGEPPNELAG
jgi:hypothetical protein